MAKKEATKTAEHGPSILFLDAYDSFSNNVTALLTNLLDVNVSVLPIDSPYLRPDTADFRQRLRRELSHYDAVVCGPGPGSPDKEADVGLMAHLWTLQDTDVLPVLGICLGFQSLVTASGGRVRRLRRGLHGMVREILHQTDSRMEGGIFDGVGPFKATLYHSLCADIGQDAVSDAAWKRMRWKPSQTCPDLVPQAWVEEQREEGEERVLMAVKHKDKPFWGLQYHPESVCTEEAGKQVIINWFREARGWNVKSGRKVDRRGHAISGQATRPSLLSSLPLTLGEKVQEGVREKDWWQLIGVDHVLHSKTLTMPTSCQLPDIVEHLGLKGSEMIVLDSANAASVNARDDVRGRYSLVAAGLEEALRIEHHAGDAYATVRLKIRAGLPVDLSQQILLARYGSVWAFLAAFHDARRLEPGASVQSPFLGGFMGYMTYEQGLSDINVALASERKHDRPDICLAWVTKSLVIDQAKGIMHVQHLLPRDAKDTDHWIDETTSRLKTSLTTLSSTLPSFSGRGKDVLASGQRSTSALSIEWPIMAEYEAKVERCQEHIAAGDSYELCLTDQTRVVRPLSDAGTEKHIPSSPRIRRRSSHPPRNSWQLFKMLRTRQPAPFASYVRLGGATLVSASPERFLQYGRTGLCSMRPMKGTVRKSEAVQTLEQAEAILHVPKEEAENLMIVDLVRHDLHGICGPGQVSVPHLLKVEEYQDVFQMITVVEGQLPRTGDYTGLDVLAASLPPGSMTGAPKKRSCELLQEIEEGRERSLYSGVLGYMCASGGGDWSVTIRCMFRWDDELQDRQSGVQAHKAHEAHGAHEVWHVGAGGAVTALSTAEEEREEMLTKLAGTMPILDDSIRWEELREGTDKAGSDTSKRTCRHVKPFSSNTGH